jgi:hypothetical protein
MEKEQWDDTRSLRQKLTNVEKEWDKTDVALTHRIIATKAPTSTHTGNPTPCVALTAVPVVRLRHNPFPYFGRFTPVFAVRQKGCPMTDIAHVKLRPLEREDLRFVHQLDNNASVMRYWFEEP